MQSLITARKIWGLLNRGERRSFGILVALMIAGMGFEMLGVGLIVPVITLFMQPDLLASYPALAPLLAALGNPGPNELVAGVMIALIAVYVVKALFYLLLVWQGMRFVYGLRASLSQRLFRVYLFQPYTFHLQRNSAQLMRNALSEVGTFTANVIHPVTSLLTNGLLTAGLFGLLLVIEPAGTLLVAGVLGGATWLFLRATRSRLARWGKARQHHDGLRIKHLQQGLGGAKDVKLLGREADFLAQYEEHNTQSAHVHQYQSTLQQLPRMWLEVLAVGGLAALVLIQIAQGRALNEILPTLGLFAAAGFRLMPSATRVIAGIQSLRFGLPVVDTLHEEFCIAVPDRSAPKDGELPFGHTCTLEHVTYSYPGGFAPAIEDVSLAIRRGEAVGFIGPSGAGKSTLVDIVLGLLAPDRGQVCVDGIDIQAHLRAWQDQVGYVPQAIFLTDDTLRRNIAFGLPEPEVDDAAVARAVKAAQLEDFVQSLPAGWDTIVGERGIRLSGGQKQRIGIARALYHDPAVLVLDEATSSLDTGTERELMDAINALRGAKTILIVAHRASTVARCDRLYRLRAGRVVEEGSPSVILRELQVA